MTHRLAPTGCVEVKRALHEDVAQFGRWIGRDLRFAKNLYMHLGVGPTNDKASEIFGESFRCLYIL